MQQDTHPELRRAVRRLLHMSRGTIRFVRPVLGLARLLVRQPPILDEIETSDLSIDGAGREIDVRLCRPAGKSTALPVLVWIHGGGLIIGDHRDDAWGGYDAGRLGIAELTLEDAGKHELKGIPDRWRLYRVTS